MSARDGWDVPSCRRKVEVRWLSAASASESAAPDGTDSLLGEGRRGKVESERGRRREQQMGAPRV